MKNDTRREPVEEEVIEKVEETNNLEEDQITALEQQIVESENKYKRALADYHNLQKRVREEKEDWIKSANKELLLRLLPVLDTLFLAQSHIENDGLTVTINQFLDALKAEGVTRIEPVGKAFDPALMDCVTIEEGEENKVLKEIRAGYLMHDKVLRPAQVTVGKKQ